MKKDSRNRVRFTHKGVRYQIGPKGTLHAYNRYNPFHNAERSAGNVPVSLLDRDGRNKLWKAILVARHPEYSTE